MCVIFIYPSISVWMSTYDEIFLTWLFSFFILEWTNLCLHSFAFCTNVVLPANLPVLVYISLYILPGELLLDLHRLAGVELDPEAHGVGLLSCWKHNKRKSSERWSGDSESWSESFGHVLEWRETLHLMQHCFLMTSSVAILTPTQTHFPSFSRCVGITTSGLTVALISHLILWLGKIQNYSKIQAPSRLPSQWEFTLPIRTNFKIMAKTKEMTYLGVFWLEEGPAQEDEDASIISLGTWKQPPALCCGIYPAIKNSTHIHNTCWGEWKTHFPPTRSRKEFRLLFLLRLKGPRRFRNSQRKKMFWRKSTGRREETCACQTQMWCVRTQAEELKEPRNKPHILIWE